MEWKSLNDLALMHCIHRESVGEHKCLAESIHVVKRLFLVKERFYKYLDYYLPDTLDVT